MFTSIPFPIVEDRPLIAYHPGPHWNYLASWNVMVDNGQPFVLICDDLGPDYPDGGWGQHSKDGMEYFARVDNPIGIGQAYRNPDLPFQNLLVHRQIDAKIGMENLPFIDIMYIDFPELFTGYNEQPKHPLLRAASSLSSKVRDGGLIISDRKNFDDYWTLPKEEFQVDENVMWDPLGPPHDNFSLELRVVDDGLRLTEETADGNYSTNEPAKAEMYLEDMNVPGEEGLFTADSADELVQRLMNTDGGSRGQGEWVWSVVAQQSDPDPLFGDIDPDPGNDWELVVEVVIMRPNLTEVATGASS